MTHTLGTLFSGIGVPDLAWDTLGGTCAWMVEKEPFCQRVLRTRFPDVALYGDIFDCHDLPPVDVIVAGFPCQPFSVAGRRRGDQDERYLVPEMLRVIGEVMPRVVVLENVPGFASLAAGDTFKQLLRALAEMGFDAEWGHLAAADFGAPHRRERWFLVAYHDGVGRDGARGVPAQLILDDERDNPTPQPERHVEFHAAVGGGSAVADAQGVGQSRAVTGRSRRGRPEAAVGNVRRLVGHADHAGRRKQRRAVAVRAQQPAAECTGAFSGDGDRPAQSRVGRDAPRPADWLDGRGRWPARPGEPQAGWEPPRVLPAGLPGRAARLKALGNSMVFPVMLAILGEVTSWLDARAEVVTP